MEIRRVAPGDRVLDYRLHERLGEGGFGEVFRAEHEVLRRVVAIKVPRDESGLAALRHEGVVQASLDHPNVVRTLEVSLSHDPPFVVMEYVDGSSLADLLKRQGALPWRQGGRILLEAARALAFAHGRGVVHGDVKPGNLLVEPGRVGRVLLTDFGLGRVFEGPQGNLQISRSLELASSGAEVQGTIRYLAPEVLRGESADERADVYAFAVLLFETVTGRLPEGREVPTDLVPKLPTTFDRVFEQCFTRKARRPRDFKAVIEQLEQLLEPEVPTARTVAVAAPPEPAAASSSAQARHGEEREGPVFSARVQDIRHDVQGFDAWRDGFLAQVTERMTQRPGVAVADGRGFDACFGVTTEGEPHHRIYTLLLPNLDAALARATVAEARRIFDMEKGIWEKEVTFWIVAQNVEERDQVLWALKGFSMGWWRRRRIVLQDVPRGVVYATELGCDPEGNPLKRSFFAASREAVDALQPIAPERVVGTAPRRALCGTAWGAAVALVMTVGFLGSVFAVELASRHVRHRHATAASVGRCPATLKTHGALGQTFDAAVAPRAPASGDAAVAPRAPASGDAAVAPRAPASGDAAVAPRAPASGDAAVAPRAPASGDAAVAPRAPASGDAAVAPRAPASGDAAVAPRAPASGDAAVAPRAPASGDAAVAPRAPASGDAAVAPRAPASGDAAVAPRAPASGDAAVAPRAPASGDAAARPRLPERQPDTFTPRDMPLPRWY